MSAEKNWQLELEEYIKQGEPGRIEKSEAWQTAIGLQAIDGLKTSAYLLDTAKEHIEGKISIDEAQKRIQSYYEQHTDRIEIENDTKEADIVSTRITKLLGEKQFSYEGLSVDASVRHLAKFTSDIWQIHPFCEGNTRATAVFMIKYMKTFGFHISNDVFEKNSWYFRNALVRANYNDLQNGVHATTKFLEMFFSNLILGTSYELKNRYMHVNYAEADTFQSSNSKVPKCQIGTLGCTLEELAILELILKNPAVKQAELVAETGKSLRSIKRIMESLQKKHYIRRVNGKRYGKWEVTRC